MRSTFRTTGDIKSVPILFLDIETTGLHPDRGAWITEIALLGDRGVRLATKLQPGDDRILSTKLPYLIDQLGSGVVVGHNVQFDLRFIAYEADRLGETGPDLQFIDTLGLARKLLTRARDHCLKTALRAFDITPRGELHSAITDARAVRSLFWRMIDHGGFGTLADAGLKPLNWRAF